MLLRIICIPDLISFLDELALRNNRDQLQHHQQLAQCPHLVNNALMGLIRTQLGVFIFAVEGGPLVPCEVEFG